MTAEPSDERPRFYGRRRGRPLRPNRERLVETLLPRLAAPNPAAGPVRPAAMFDRPMSAYWLEIGFGGGEHLVWQASENPDVGLIGAEPFIAGVARCLSAIEAAGVDNLRIHADDARPLMAALPEASIGRAFVLQPDPWRKRRHWERRLIGPDGLEALARVLADGAELRASTDHPGYQIWMLRHLRADARFEWLASGADDWRRRPDDWPETRYEAKAIREGRRPMYLRFLRRPRTAGA
ncbi:MAG: tRNA (guanine(46)-N(7))-methyltransferase TrmB [Alphaproteobacteria bacterium]